MINNRVADIIISLSLLLFISPVIVMTTLIILSTGTKPFFLHTRVGFNGKEFKCYKFTSMRSISSLSTDEVERVTHELSIFGKVNDDPRITKIGKFIRKTSIDEIPQLINVLKGDMSLIGPRPITNKEIKIYGKYIEHYLSTKPGVTGLWQVTGRSNTSYRRRVAIDCYYSKNKSIKLNVFIMIKTLFVVCKMEGAQ
ncbi:sugar transferase [Klebsiella pneumoniae]|uniref:sugar transferase n=1 Tax=Klebsiella pneumoniae TaxID=573 RepID=UPI0010373BD8|nr:sugar transferase [Klebsiella pneumoniae]TBO67165.1 sugar transferase [Klebsiella pneumoniae]TBO84398.1 sugar transferase [Klebsiella pneumoniae]TBP53020.1 sugar transferase [Klebsiella pneumoniae]